jgi:hypothetical protein
MTENLKAAFDNKELQGLKSGRSAKCSASTLRLRQSAPAGVKYVDINLLAKSAVEGKIMLREKTRVAAVAVKSIVLGFMLSAALHAIAQDAETSYPSMAPLEQYLTEDRNSEIALARSAAPESISRDAEVMVLGRHGYETVIKGTNGFVCIVERSWTSPVDDPNFWNPKGRAPVCYNAAAARTYLPRTIKKTDLILAGRTKAQNCRRWNSGRCVTCFPNRAI